MRALDELALPSWFSTT